jgi:Zn-dependent peptidase ImmA (M78 family)
VDEAFKNWRKILEEHGVFVFKEAFKSDTFSGFCLYDKQFPVIYVNNSKSSSRQIFTLFHELAHLLFGTGGVDTQLEDYIYYLKGDDKAIEVLCNRFGGEFLVPDADFNHQIKGVSISDELIQRLANRYSVSREVILRKFLNRRAVDQRYYEEKVAQWAKKSKTKAGAGGDYYLTKGAYLGEHYLETAFSRYYQRRISIEQLADYLGVKVKNVTGMESLLFDKGAIA